MSILSIKNIVLLAASVCLIFNDGNAMDVAYNHTDILPALYVVSNDNLALEIKREPNFADSYGQIESIKVTDTSVYKIPENALELNEIYFDFKIRNNWRPRFDNHHIKFVDGIAHCDGKPATYKFCGVNPIRYVMGIDGDLYISNQTTGSHSTLVNGAYCLGAGMLLFNDEGKILNLDNGSGHIMPSERQFLAVCKYLAYLGALSSNCKFSTFQSGAIKYEDLLAITPDKCISYSQEKTVEGDFGIAKEFWAAQHLAPNCLPSQPLTVYEKFLRTYEKIRESIRWLSMNMSTLENEERKYSPDENFQDLYPKLAALKEVHTKIGSLEGRISVLKRGDHPADLNKTLEERLELISSLEKQIIELYESHITSCNEPWMDYLVINGKLKM